MRAALAEAEQAAGEGEVPVGAVVVANGQVVASGHNSPIGSHDPSAHAEIVALRRACEAQSNYRLSDATLIRDAGALRDVHRCHCSIEDRSRHFRRV